MNTNDLLGEDASLWLETTDRTDFDPLETDHEVDVAIVGGGIAGLSAAAELTNTEKTIAVLEADRICSGVTARTTAKVTSQRTRVRPDSVPVRTRTRSAVRGRQPDGHRNRRRTRGRYRL
ncbi:FAD-dependent oxidoreductase (plasmid) [Haladaptatus sp. SPP-AMP-3]|uniref:FAD-dependent oxidoreductase n=1 Tax=Haladaptatus sp. SPP-AMP-3 TaxID=3121295 RepID=UPI003C2BD266